MKTWSNLGMKYALLIFGLFCNFSAVATGIAPEPTRNLMVLDGFAQAIKESDGIVYVGGNFKRVGPWTGSAALVNATSGELAEPNFPAVNGVIGAAAEDGAGGFFIIGDFTNIGGTAKSNIAHITAAGALNASWTAQTTNSIRGISVANGRVYYFGESEKENTFTVTKVRALNLADGSPTDLTITVRGTINQILATADRIYVAGDFTQATTSQAWYLAAYGLDGQLLPWNPGVNGEVSQMAISGDTIYYAGFFSVVGGQLRDGIAASSISAGQLSAWYPGAINVSLLKLVEDTLYIAGGFNAVHGQSRTNFAAFSAITGELLPFQAAASATAPRAMAVGPDYIAIVGDVGFNVASPVMFLILDRATGAVRPTSLKPNMTVMAAIARGENVFVGGAFSMLKGENRLSAAAFRVDTGEITDWNPGANSNVLALAVTADKVIIAGELSSVGGEPRKQIAAVDRNSGALIPGWQADANFGVIDVAVYHDRLYVGGIFTNIGGMPRTNIAALDLDTGAVLPFNPALNRGMVRAIKIAGDTMYIGGLINRVGTETRNRLAAFDLTTETLTAWNPGANTSGSNIEDIEVDGETVYVVGRFTAIGGQPRTNAAAISVTGELLPWAPNPNRNTTDVEVHGDIIFLAGEFENVGGQLRRVLAAVNRDGQVLDWAPEPQFLGFALEAGNDQIYFGGAFYSLSGEVRFGFGGFGFSETSVEPPTVDLSSVKFTAAFGTFEFNIQGGPILVTPQYSTDLQNWNDLPAITIDGTGTFQDANASSRNVSFYRLKIGP